MGIFKEPDLEEFRSGNLVINCRTEELTKEFIDWCDDNNIRNDFSSISAIFDRHKEFTCFRHGYTIIRFDHIYYYELQGYTVKEFKGFNQSEDEDTFVFECEVPIYEDGMPTLLEYFMELHNLAEGEEFTVNSSGRYRIIKSEIEVLNIDEDWRTSFISAIDLNNLKITKLPWKPKKGETYYLISLDFQDEVIRCLEWHGAPFEENWYVHGLVFKTREEAEEIYRKIMELTKKQN